MYRHFQVLPPTRRTVQHRHRAMYGSMTPYGLARNDGVREASNVKEATVSGIENLPSLLLGNSDASALIAVSPFTGFHQVGTAPHATAGSPPLTSTRCTSGARSEQAGGKKPRPDRRHARPDRRGGRGVGVPECCPKMYSKPLSKGGELA